MNIYDIGDLVRLTGEFKDKAGAKTDPTSLTLTIRPSFGAVVTKTMAQVNDDGTGLFSYEFVPDKAGLWHYRWVGTGSVAAAEEKSFQVRRRKA